MLYHPLQTLQRLYNLQYQRNFRSLIRFRVISFGMSIIFFHYAINLL